MCSSCCLPTPAPSTHSNRKIICEAAKQSTFTTTFEPNAYTPRVTRLTFSRNWLSSYFYYYHIFFSIFRPGTKAKKPPSFTLTTHHSILPGNYYSRKRCSRYIHIKQSPCSIDVIPPLYATVFYAGQFVRHSIARPAQPREFGFQRRGRLTHS